MIFPYLAMNKLVPRLSKNQASVLPYVRFLQCLESSNIRFQRESFLTADTQIPAWQCTFWFVLLILTFRNAVIL